jgi:hypothetical protein
MTQTTAIERVAQAAIAAGHNVVRQNAHRTLIVEPVNGHRLTVAWDRVGRLRTATRRAPDSWLLTMPAAGLEARVLAWIELHRPVDEITPCTETSGAEEDAGWERDLLAAPVPSEAEQAAHAASLPAYESYQEDQADVFDELDAQHAAADRFERDPQGLGEIGPARPRFPEGTPEYAAYRRELTAELAKFTAGEPPYDRPAPCTVSVDRIGSPDQPEYEVGRWDADEAADVHVATFSRPEAEALYAALRRALHDDRTGSTVI